MGMPGRPLSETAAMPRKATGLTAAKVRTALPGRYGDGGGLYLLVRPGGGRFWLYRYVINGRMREMGLGSAAGRDAVTLANARTKARTLWESVRAGRDPLDDREAEAAAKKAAALAAVARAKTFKDVAMAYIEANEAGWRNAKHRAQWASTLEAYAYPQMGELAVGDIDTGHVMSVLEPIWRTKTETASRLRGRIEAVLDYAKARGWRTGENPARWRGHVANMLPNKSKVQPVDHHAALPWREIGGFVATLRTENGLAAQALLLTILTAGRSSEVLEARWSEIDLTEAIWTIPGSRMKAGREHRVPLSDAAMAVLRGLLPLRDTEAGNWVFPGARKGRPLSNMAMEMTLRRMNRGDLTVHGFRSTFRDWTSETTGYPREVAEAALAHTLGDKTEAAYRRGDLFDKRRRLMDDWAAFCERVATVDATITSIRQPA
jgi:integrase